MEAKACLVWIAYCPRMFRDLQFDAKELARTLAPPYEQDRARLKRVIGYYKKTRDFEKTYVSDQPIPLEFC